MWRDWLMQSASWLLLGVSLGVLLGDWLRRRRARDKDASNEPLRGNSGDRLLVLEQITLETDADGQMSRVVMGVSGVTGEYVERWLDERGLVMTPKAVDFRHKAQSNEPRQPG